MRPHLSRVLFFVVLLHGAGTPTAWESLGNARSSQAPRLYHCLIHKLPYSVAVGMSAGCCTCQASLLVQSCALTLLTLSEV